MGWRDVVWCGAVRCGAPKALLPEGKGRDVYPRVQVNGRAVRVVRALCASVHSTAESRGMHWSACGLWQLTNFHRMEFNVPIPNSIPPPTRCDSVQDCGMVHTHSCQTYRLRHYPLERALHKPCHPWCAISCGIRKPSAWGEHGLEAVARSLVAQREAQKRQSLRFLKAHGRKHEARGLG